MFYFLLFIAVIIAASIYFILDWESKHEDGE
jgi:hypothetical protein